MTKKQAQRWLDKEGPRWQALLGLQDWSITFKAASSEEIIEEFGEDSDDEYYGRNLFNAAHRRSIIYVNYERNVKAGDCTAYKELVKGLDMKQTLVHELLHCVVFENQDELTEERSINQLTAALLKLEGGGA